MKLLRNLFILLAAVAVFFQVGCRKKEVLPENILAMLNQQSPAVVRIGVYGDPLGLNPIAHINSEHGRMVNNFVHASPLRKLPDGGFEPYLFDSYHLLRGENGTVILEAVWKTNLKWHDGTDFDARDLEFTIQSIKNGELQSPYVDLASGVVSITSLDRGKRTRMVFSRDSRQFLDLLTLGVLPAHLLAEVPVGDLKASADLAESASYTWAAYMNKPVGLGPYAVKSREKGSYMVLEPSPHFFDAGVASRPVVLVRTSYDYQELISDFRGKKYDWINLPSMLAEQLETMSLEKVRFVRYPNPATMVWLFNNRRPGLSDVRVRQALDLIADRQKIKNLAPADGRLLFGSPLASDSALVTDYQQRFARALQLLDEAGLKDNTGDGFRELNGQVFAIEILVNDDNMTRRVIADRILEDLRRAGIQATVKAVSWAEFVAGRLRSADFDTALVSYSLPRAGNWTAFLHSSAGESNSLNFAGVNDSALDGYLDKLDSMFYDAETQVAYNGLIDYIDQQKPVAFLFKPFDVGLYHAESGSSTAIRPIWDDVLSWKVLFGPADSQL